VSSASSVFLYDELIRAETLLVLLQGDVLVHLACTLQGLPPGFLLPPDHHQKAPPEFGVDEPHTAASLHKHYTKLLAKTGKRDKESQIKQMSEGALLALRTLGNSFALLHMVSNTLAVDASSGFMGVAPFLGIQHMESMGEWPAGKGLGPTSCGRLWCC
jgi:hypothetical protein